MRVLVIGGAGYIGSVLVEELLRANYKVDVLDNFMYKQNSLSHLVYHDNLNLVKGDFRDNRVLKPLVAQADIVIPLAAIVGAPACDRDPVLAESVNIEAPLQLFSQLNPEILVLMPTTNSAYGSGDAQNFCDEKSPLRPVSRYAEMKVKVENALLQRENSVSLRLATVFGISARMRLDLLVNDFTYRALTDRYIVLFESNFMRNYIHVRDVAAAFLFCLENIEAVCGEIFNVGLSNANLSKKQLCERIKLHIPEFVYFESPIGKDPDQRNYVVSNEKIESLGFRPKSNLDDGICEIKKAFPMIHPSMRNI